jgi:hypothetical protein
MRTGHTRLLGAVLMKEFRAEKFGRKALFGGRYAFRL